MKKTAFVVKNFHCLFLEFNFYENFHHVKLIFTDFTKNNINACVNKYVK